jgi:peptidoglycan hydrolase CwlO-like protein
MTLEQQLKDRLKIATNLQAEIASLRAEVMALHNEMTSFAIAQRLFGDSLNALQQEVRATLNDIRLRQEERAA